MLVGLAWLQLQQVQHPRGHTGNVNKNCSRQHSFASIWDR